MTQPTISRPNFEMSSDDVAKWLVVLILAVAAMTALFFARRVLAPVDSFVTRQACATYGREELSREVVDSERSNGFSLINRSDGYCVFGPVVQFDDRGEVIEPQGNDGNEGDAVVVDSVTVSLADIDEGPLYQGAKIMFVVLQLGAASVAVRMLADPLLDRFVRRPASR